MMDDMGLDDGHHKFGMPGSDDSSDSMSGTLMRQPKKIPTVLKALPKKGPKSRKKNPDAPKRFKSSFIFFSMAKHKQIKEHLANQGEAARTTNITKMVSDAWRNMGPEEREVYDDLAREDKARYEKEKANYQGPLGGAGSKKVKDPNAPKRPMSAFLAFANSRRGEVKGRNSECSNGEISKLLSVMWKEADEDIKKKYRENEAALWAAYKVSIAEYRKKNDGRKKAKAVEDFDDDEDSPAPAKKRKKRKVKQSKHDEEDIPPVSGEEFDDHHLSGGGFDTLGNPNQDEMMAASALRGVRGGPNSYSFGGSSGNDLQKQLQQQQDQLDRLQQQQQQQLEQAQMNSSGYSSLFGMSGMNPYAALSGGGGNGNNGLSGSLPSGLGVGALSGGLGGSGMPGGLGGNGMSGSLGGGGLSGGLGVGGLSGGLGGSGLPGGLGGSGLPGGLGVGSLPGGLGGSGLGGSGLGGSGLGGGLGGSGLPSGLGGGGLSQDNSRALLEMGIPYGLQNYGGLGGNGLGGGGLGGGGLGGGGLGGGGLGGSGLGGLGGGGLSGGGLGGGGLGVGGLGGGGLGGSLGDSQAMLMAQALHGNPNPYNNHLLGLGGGQQQSLSQLASLAGQRGGGGGSQGYQGMGGGGMGNLLNDNSNGSGMGRMGDHQGRY